MTLWRRVHYLVGSAAIVSAACGQDSGIDPKACPDLGGAVTSAAAQQLDAAGCFNLPAVAAEGPPVLTADSARRLAERFAVTFFAQSKSFLEAGRGGPIALEGLRAWGRVYYAQAPYAPLRPAVPTAFKNGYGSHWLVALCDPQGLLQASVAVAVRLTYLTLFDGKYLLWPSDVQDVLGNEFWAVGAPVTWDGALSIGPEAAALLAFRVTGRRARAVPRLLLRESSYSAPQGAVWVVLLDGAARLQGVSSNRAYSADTVYVGQSTPFNGTPDHYGPAQLLVATPDQPTASAALVPSTFADFMDSTGGARDSIYRRPDAPLMLEAAVASP